MTAAITEPSPPEEGVECPDIEIYMSDSSGDDDCISKLVTKDTKADSVITQPDRLDRKTGFNMPKKIEIQLSNSTKKQFMRGSVKHSLGCTHLKHVHQMPTSTEYGNFIVALPRSVKFQGSRNAQTMSTKVQHF